MQQLDLIIHNATGLHARPARLFVDIAKQYQSTIRLRHGEKSANAKSLISVLKLGVAHGQRIQIDVNGDDEELAAAALAAAVRDGLGEGGGSSGAAAAAPVESAVETPTPGAAQAADERRANGAVVRGVPGAPGLAVGPVYHLQRVHVEVHEAFAGVEQEQARLQEALKLAQQQLVALYDQLRARTDSGEAVIFQVHHELLCDAEILQAVHAGISAGSSAATAWQQVISQQAQMLAQLPDPLLAERASDLRDVGQRVLALLGGVESAPPALPDVPVIVVAYDLTPSETAALDPQRVLGFCTAVGGPTAHTAILARALGLPAVVGAGPAALEIAPGTLVVLDGSAGTLAINPDEQALGAAQTVQRQDHESRAAATLAAAEPALTRDGRRVEVAANVGGLADARKAAACGAEGVGLLRTEFLFLERSQAPSEEEQFAVYRDIVQTLGGQPVIIRTLDIGGDKPLPYLDLPAEANPFLGERGIRLCLAHPELLRQQLRAILRAAAYGRLRIMFPMIADLSDLRAARAIVEQVSAELDAPPVEVGIMVEVPSAALMADALAQEVAFFSIGTNDLTQYTLAMDRTHPRLGALADGLHPAVLRLIARTCEAAHAAGRWVGVCGELAADQQAIPILIGLGVDELSVSAPAVPLVKAQIRSLNSAECRERARRALACASAEHVRKGAERP